MSLWVGGVVPVDDLLPDIPVQPASVELLLVLAPGNIQHWRTKFIFLHQVGLLPIHFVEINKLVPRSYQKAKRCWRESDSGDSVCGRVRQLELCYNELVETRSTARRKCFTGGHLGELQTGF